MHKLLVLYSPPTSPEAFRQHYEGHHLPLVARLPGLLSSWHAFDLQALDGGSPYFCAWQGTFASEQSMNAALQSEIGQQVAADAAQSATGGMVAVHMRAEMGAGTGADMGADTEVDAHA